MLAVLFLLLAASPIYAQQALAPVQDSVVQAVADEAELTPATALPKVGTFWVMTTGYNGNLTALPYPTLPARLSALPTYAVAGNIFIVDDTDGQLAPSSARRMNSVQAASTLQAQVQTVAGLIERIQMAGSDENNQAYQPNGFTSMIDTNGLWLEASNKVTSLGLRLHNTVGGDNYQLLFKTNLLIFVCRRCRNFPHGLIDNVTQGNFQGTGDPQQSVEVGNSHFALNVTDGLLRKACADTERRHRNAALHSLVLQNFADPRTNCLPIFL